MIFNLGGGGRTNTQHLVSPAVGSGYAVTIGGGGGLGHSGGSGIVVIRNHREAA